MLYNEVQKKSLIRLHIKHFAKCFMWPQRAQMTSLWMYFLFAYIFFHVSEVQPWRPRLHATAQQMAIDFLRVNSKVVAGADFLQQMAVQSYHKHSQGAGEKVQSATGVCNPTQTSGQTRRCCLLTVWAQKEGGSRKPFSPWHHFTALFDCCLWLKVKSGIRVEPGPSMPWNENLLTQFSLQQLQ